MLKQRMLATAVMAGLGVGVWSAGAMADWPTNRGNAQRTGNVDNQPGPKTAKVLWVYESSEHFIASPVAGEKAIVVSGLGSFNTAAIYALAMDPAARQRVVWKKGPPALKQAVVCSPAIVDGKMVFGDGMHQTDGGTLHCVKADSGLPLWQYPVPGTLVHLEGSPAVANGKVYISGGAAGVICVDMNRITLDGQEMDLAQAAAQIDQKWKELSERYEQDKKKDPDFAIPPSEDALPKPMPKLVWQFGQEKLHVDSSVSVVGDRVLVGSAFLDEEKLGDRAVYCLDANSGALKWKTPVQWNPWGGPTVAGDTIIVGCSSIRFDPKLIPGAKGQVVAMDLNSGQIKWKQDLEGGVVCSVAVAEDTAVFTATDGRVRGLSIKDGQEKWSYDAQAPFFAGPAVAGGVAYAGDLKGVIHAVSLKDGQGLWKLDLGSDPAVQAPGMVYGSPIVHGGRVYVGTCNLETGQQRTAVVCIGEQ
jgi:outer membrane protein assembly factor BamB